MTERLTDPLHEMISPLECLLLFEEVQFLCQVSHSVLVGQPGELDTLRHEATHVCQDRQHEGDPHHPEYQTEQPTSEG